ncbi:MAG: LysM peptidoglycan-binding domain-containing protein [Phototrophicaceae bacterium]
MAQQFSKQLISRAALALIALAMVTAACSLGASEPTPTPTQVSHVTLTPLPTFNFIPTNTPQPTRTTSPGDGGGSDGGSTCTPRTDWLLYTVASGDTLGDIASRANTTAVELMQGNCLANPNLITVGQQMRVPRLPVARPIPTSTPPPLPRGAVNVQPLKRIENGTYVLPSQTSVTLSWDSVPAGASEVRFYSVPTGTNTWDCCRSLLGIDNTVSAGQASVQWMTPRSGPLGFLAAEALGPTGTSLIISESRLAYVEDPASQVGGVSIDQQIVADAGNIFLLRGATATLRYLEAPSGLAQVRFVLIAPGGSGEQLIAIDDNPQDGWRAQWTIPAGVRGTLQAQGYDSAGNLMAVSLPVEVSSGPPPGGGCMITANTPINYYDEPNTTDQPAVGSLSPNQSVETLGRSLAGYYGFYADGSTSGAQGVDALVWIPPDADITTGQNCQ